jgi:hypothetical protein
MARKCTEDARGLFGAAIGVVESAAALRLGARHKCPVDPLRICESPGLDGLVFTGGLACQLRHAASLTVQHGGGDGTGKNTALAARTV